MDGVLFIDEAYSLVAESSDDAYGTEAVQALLKRMEDDRSRLVVVMAGYPDPMDQLIRSNPGLSSRFQRTFSFPDYTPDEQSHQRDS
jgi:SpoVK/Ycf46/Vps4 family AAA+-type ATPase